MWTSNSTQSDKAEFSSLKWESQNKEFIVDFFINYPNSERSSNCGVVITFHYFIYLGQVLAISGFLFLFIYYPNS